MTYVPDLSGNGHGSRPIGRLDLDNITTVTIAAEPNRRILISNFALTLDAAGTISITDGTTPMKFKLTAAGAITLDRKDFNDAWYYRGASGVAVTISTTAGNLSGFVEYTVR